MNKELFQRVMTGVVGGAVLLLIIIFGGWVGVTLVAGIVSLGMVFELSKLGFSLSDHVRKRNLLLAATWIIAVINAAFPFLKFELITASFILIVLYFLFSAEQHGGDNLLVHFRELVLSIFTLLYLIFLPLYLPLIMETAEGVHWVILFFLIIWSGDTAAYFGGKKYGKRKLYPLISPKKTQEGCVAGLLAGLIISLIYKVLVFSDLNWLGVFFIPILVGVASIAGDLSESFIKRSYAVKDSGSILPGHGGFLDRFDGMLLALPVMYLCVKLF